MKLKRFSCRGKIICFSCGSPDVGNEKTLIDALRRKVGEQDFAQLITQVVPQAAQIVERALHEIL